MTQTIKTLLVDLDGTLVDSYDSQYAAWKNALKEFGINIRKKDFDDVSGLDSLTAVKHLFSDGSENDWSLVVARKDIEFRKKISKIRLFGGATELLQLARNLGCKVGLVTSTGRYDLERILSLFNILDSFDLLLSVDEIKIPKPNPALLLNAISKLDGDPCRTIFIGDAIVDMIMAQRASVISIGVSNDSEKRIGLSEAGADNVAIDLFAVMDFFKSWVETN